MEYRLEVRDSIWLLMRSFKTSMRAALLAEGLDINPMQVRVLLTIEAEAHCTANSVANQLQRDKAQVTKLVKELLARELVMRLPHPSDKRSQILQLTDRGSNLLTKLHDAEKRVISTLLDGLTDQEIAVFESAVNKMAGNLNTYRPRSDHD